MKEKLKLIKIIYGITNLELSKILNLPDYIIYNDKGVNFKIERIIRLNFKQYFGYSIDNIRKEW